MASPIPEAVAERGRACPFTESDDSYLGVVGDEITGEVSRVEEEVEEHDMV